LVVGERCPVAGLGEQPDHRNERGNTDAGDIDATADRC
jgi:hypothetical protein